MTNYQVLTQDRMDELIAAGVESREQELANYQLNIDNFNDMLAELDFLPAEWPAHLAQYRGTKLSMVANELSEEDFDLLSDLQQRDHIRMLLRTTKAEQKKSQRAHNAILKRIPDARLQAALTRVKSNRS